jgi:N-acetylmuramic acid 6-phosphate etherase
MSTTETASPRYAGIDDWPTADLVAGMTDSQFAAIGAVQAAGADIARVIDAAVPRLEAGGRLIYLGAGTSGRIATQDAVELRPTFNWPGERSITLMAGGEAAFIQAQEGAEDDEAEAPRELDAAGVGPDDVVIGVAASGRTPFAIAGLVHARAKGALTVGVFNNRGGRLGEVAEIAVLLETGPEFLAGSTRMKAGTAQKVALNVISTAVMIRLGYVYRGKMVEMRPSNAKLRERAVRMVADLTGAGPEAARAALAAAGGTIKTAVVMLDRGCTRPEAEAALAAAGGRLGRALAG